MHPDPPPDHDDLDPSDWPSERAQAHRMLDDILDHVEHVRGRPVWRPIPEAVKNGLREPCPREPTPLAEVHQQFLRLVLPYGTGNVHPGFMGWVHGGGSVAGMLGEMLAAGLNANLGGREHMPIEVERQILRWLAPLFGMPGEAGGLFVTGSSMANFMAILVARTGALGPEVRPRGLAAMPVRLAAYASAAVHGCVRRGMEMAGLGGDALRQVAVDRDGRMDPDALLQAVRWDRAAGLRPFLVVATAGTVDTGAIDDLEAVAAIAQAERLWFHVDGAYGALAILAPGLAPRLAGIQRADSLALDFHKWGQVPYDAGYLLVRDGALQQRTFAAPAVYLGREARGLAAGSPWPCDFGPDLSRGFRALKVWFTLKVYGTERLGAVIAHTCALAQYLKARVEACPRLELMAPVSLNIVCFRVRGADPDRLNRRVVELLQESGRAAPSTTTLDGQLVIRAAIVNHRTQSRDIDALIAATLEIASHLLET
ncbi:MAG: aspartate aminotransferase family protein [Holophaga sp.]|nr:aspartate aminotransferase family protein [Holophaga sp.]